MEFDFFAAALVILIFFAVMDLVVGVSNDAVNFLNPSVGCRVAPRHIILIVASLGLIVGVLFSSGMMEIARRGIFHPQFFTMPELLMLFLAVMIADVLVLDTFNTFGLPTSTTVSVVFELLGAAVAISVIKIIDSDQSLANLGDYINTAKALTIITGILLSVAVAFVCGAAVQFVTRLIFTFDYQDSLRRYGALWGGVALSAISLVIMLKGAKGASFMTPERVAWLSEHLLLLLLMVFVSAALVFQILLFFFKVNILKPIVLIGTFALALAFAANDLVNFIGVPMAGLLAYETAQAAVDPLTEPMTALGGAVRTSSTLLLIAGLIMVLSLWFSKKARTVSATELSLGRQEEGVERYESMALARVVVRMGNFLIETVGSWFPTALRLMVRRRFSAGQQSRAGDEDAPPPFDLVRAAVNLMVASAVVSLATSLKLPLSTTYVTFMTAMGTSFADRAWGRDSAVYRVTGVLTVIGGWFLTGLVAFSVAFVFAVVIYFGQALGVLALLLLVGYLIWRSHYVHRERAGDLEQEAIFNIRKEEDTAKAIAVSFAHTAYLLRSVRESLDLAAAALFSGNLVQLRHERRKSKQIQKWANIITANVFKTLRLLQKNEAAISYKYGETVRCLQSIADCHRDMVLRAYVHIDDQHKELLPVQRKELSELLEQLQQMLRRVEVVLEQREGLALADIEQLNSELNQTIERLSRRQSERIHAGSSKTRLSILFYSIMGDARRLARQNVRLAEICAELFKGQAV